MDASLSDFTFHHRAAAHLAQGKSPFALPNHDYPPLLGVLLMPLGVLPLPVARLAWFGCRTQMVKW